MKSPTVAVLLSGLVFPGAGHFYLKRPLRGALLLIISLVCLWSIVSQATQQATTVLEQFELSGGGADQIASLVTQSLNQSNSASGALASLVLAGCWVIGMVDAYRLAKKTKD
jgi:TM2 domain-containing membrane protein YozV